MLMVPQQQIQDTIGGDKIRVACITGGRVVSLQVIDSARMADTKALYDDVRPVRDDEPCGEGWGVNEDGSYSERGADGADGFVIIQFA